ncbi:MAG: AAA family ATPase [Bacteroidota bacterium]|jgi:MoxR-like ATPase
MTNYATDVEAVDALAASYKKLTAEIHKQIIGQDEVVKYVLMSIFCDGHTLMVGVPGLAKTLLVKTIADTLDLSFKRIQFTPDLMPSDITGSEILSENRTFQFNRGPLFANIVLADEINRTPPKTQAALLESMQERSVTVAGTIHRLTLPFFVLATQNPIEQEGTYPLPEAQLDRFMFNIVLDYLNKADEIAMVKLTTGNEKVQLNKVVSAQEILYFQQLVRKIPVTDHVFDYAVSLVHKTRPNTESATEKVNQYISWGAGPRASQYLILGAKCHAAIQGKYAPDIDDVRAVAVPVLRHRVVLNYKAEADGFTVDAILKSLL